MRNLGGEQAPVALGPVHQRYFACNAPKQSFHYVSLNAVRERPKFMDPGKHILRIRF